jgi:tetratricopeptide (TPR) repeat protein
VYEKSSDPGLEETLKDAQKEQAAVLERCRAEMAGPEQAKDQRKLMAGICMRLAKVNEARGTAKFDEEALGLYTEALSTDELSEPCMASIARLHLRSNRGDECEAMCGKLRNTNAESDDAAMILADLKFLQAGKAETSESSARIGGGSSAPASEGKDDMGEGKDGEGKDGEVDDSPTVPKSESEVAYAAALAQYSELLEKKPNHYGALSQLIVLLRRAGKLKEINRFFKLAERSHPRARSHAGLHYCKGLYHRYTNSVHEAVKAFNLARRDGEWGRQALTNMIELYLNPDNDTLFGVSALDGAGGAVNAERMASVKAAEDLLGELSEMMPERDSKCVERRMLRKRAAAAAAAAATTATTTS